MYDVHNWLRTTDIYALTPIFKSSPSPTVHPVPYHSKPPPQPLGRARSQNKLKSRVNRSLPQSDPLEIAFMLLRVRRHRKGRMAITKVLTWSHPSPDPTLAQSRGRGSKTSSPVDNSKTPSKTMEAEVSLTVMSDVHE